MKSPFLRMNFSLWTTALLSTAALAQPSADVELTVEVISQSDSQLVSVSVRNKGPDSAANTSLQSQFPPGSLILSALPAGCVLGESNIITCALGSLARDDSATRSFQVDMGRGLFQASASSDTPDPNPANNCGALPIGPMKPSLTTGRIVCADGSPRANCPVVIEFHTTAGAVTVATNTTDANGVFAVILPCPTNPSGDEFKISTACCDVQVWRIPSTSCYGDLGDLLCNDCAARPGTIKGVKWNDHDHDGHQNGREPGIAGWTILLEPGNLTAVTDAQGNYAFSNLAAGTYTVREMPNPDWEQSFPPPPGTHTITIEPAVPVGPINFGNWKKCASPPSGLSAWWPLDEPTGAPLMLDIAGGANHATPVFSGVVGPNAPLAVSGMVALAKRFYDPPNKFGLVPDAPAVNFGVGNFTIECWIRPLATIENQQSFAPIVDKTSRVCPPLGYYLYVYNGVLTLWLTDMVGNSQTYFSTLPITYGVWQFVSVMVDRAGNVDFYIQGQYEPFPMPCLNPQSIDVPNPLWIGGSIFGGPYSDIEIDELEYFHRVLTQPELDSIYQAGRSGKCKRVCGVKFNDLNGNGVRDLNEPGLPNWKITAQGPVSASTLTDANGNYCFTNLPSGTYTVKEVQQFSWSQTAPPSAVHVVPLGPGFGVGAYNFGNWRRIFKDDTIYDHTGAARLIPTNNGAGVIVTDLGSSVSDGVLATYQPPANLDAWILIEPPVANPGAILVARWLGSYGGASNELGRLRVIKEAEDSFLLAANFSALGSASASVKLFNNNVEIAASGLNAQIRAATWPFALRARTGSIDLSAHFSSDTPVSVDNVPYLADEVRFVAEPSGIVNYISAVQIIGLQLPGFIVSDAQGDPLQPRINIALADDKVVLTWDLPGYQLQSATDLAEPLSSTIWNNEAGQSPVTLPHDDARKFFRLISIGP